MLQSKVQSDLQEAQLARDSLKVDTLRMLLAELHNAEIDKGGELADTEIVGLIQREVKKRREAAAGFRQGGREEAAVKEEGEAEILTAYLPAQLSDGQLSKIVEEVITEVGAKTAAEMGQVIAKVLGRVKGQAEGSRVSMIVKEKLLKNQ